MSAKSKASFTTCIFCSRDKESTKCEYRAEIIGRHFLSKHKSLLLEDKSFVDALRFAVRTEADTLFWNNKNYCLTCGALFITPHIQANAYTPERLAEMKKTNILKHFVKQKTHAANNKEIHKALLKEAEENGVRLGAQVGQGPSPQVLAYGLEVPPQLPHSHLEEIAKLKKELEKSKKKIEKLEAADKAYYDTFATLPKLLGKALNYNSEQVGELVDYVAAVNKIYVTQYVKDEIDEDEAETMIEDLEFPDSLQVGASEKPKNTLHNPETESLENAYKYGYQKDEDQHSDGIYEGEVNIEPWMK
jgi:hypothetical protein